MANDGDVNIGTKLDTSGLDKGIKDMQSKLDKADKSFKKSGDTTKKYGAVMKEAGGSAGQMAAKIGQIAAAAGPYAAAAVAAIAATKKTIEVLNQCGEAYVQQKKAEETLQNAARNNPYLNSENVYNLQKFSAELQNMSEVGDEVSLKVMGQLAAAGRTEEEIRQIMTAAVDMAAVTGEDLQSAANALNATLNGNAGQLGRQIKGINELTKAELENGKAIELIAAKYKGSAQATADINTQLSNSWGDFKESIGRGWERTTRPVKEFFQDILASLAEANNLTEDIKDARAADAAGTKSAQDTKLLIETDNQKLEELKEQNKKLTEQLKISEAEYDAELEAIKAKQAEWDEKYGKMAPRMRRGLGAPERPELPSGDIGDRKGGAYWRATYDANKKTIIELETEIERLNEEYKVLKAAEDEAAAAAAADAKAAEAAANAKSRDQQAAEYINANTKALKDQIAAMQLKAEVTGQEVDAGQIYNAYLQSYIDLVTKSNGLVTENNQAAKKRLEELEQIAQQAAKAATAEERLKKIEEARAAAEKLLEEAKGDTGNDIYDNYRKQAEELNKLSEDIKNNEILTEEEKTKALLDIDKRYAANKKELWAGVSAQVNGYAQQVSDIVQDAANMALDVQNNRMKAELNNLEIQYRKSELGEEEYQKKVAEAKKKGAKIQYEIEMANWSANILSATANTAVGVTEALAQGGTAGIITGALVGAAGAVQLAAIMAAKPIPHFAGGGIIGGAYGATMGSDNTVINARNGEMILNASNQRALWDMINDGNAAGGGINLIVNNSAANMVNTSARFDRDKIELMIDARINDGLKKGRFNEGLNAAQASMSGDFYGI